MPIRKEGSDDYTHFKTLFEEFLKPPIQERNYEVLRADSLPRAGAISRDVIVRLAEAELVIADLTDLNPNVYYELGVRHALRGRGTLMILDVVRTPEIPFDLSAYRVIQFSSAMEGLTKLRRDLQAFVDSLALPATHADNPVHDWLPALPLDLLASSQGTAEGKLREELARAHNVLRQFKERFGVLEPSETGETPLVRAISGAVEEVASGALPAEVMRKVIDARSRRDAAAFLEVLGRIGTLEPRHMLASQWNTIAKCAQSLGLARLVKPIYDHGRTAYPDDEDLRNAQLTYFAHSDDPDLRLMARDEFSREFEIHLSDQSATVGRMPDEPSFKIGVMLDAFHNDNLHDKALMIADAFMRAFPSSTVTVRNYARALRYIGRRDEALEWYKRSVECPDVDDSSWNWFAGYLHNRNLFFQAAVAHCRACLLDPDDATHFANVAMSLSLGLRWQMQGKLAKSEMPTNLSVQTVEDFIRAGLSCDPLEQSDIDSMEGSGKRVGTSLSLSLFRHASADDDKAQRMTMRQRFDLATQFIESMSENES